MFALCVQEYVAHGVRQNRNLTFNSLHAARKYMIEKLNMKQTKDYIEKLRAGKRLDMEKFNQREYLLYRSYGMVDVPLHTIDSIVSDIEYRGVYIYRIGNSEPTSPSLTFTVERKGTSSI
jgi:hypothetical protein